MDTIIKSKKIPTPPAFMATTRQKIMLMHHHLPEQYYPVKQSKTLQAFHSIGNFAKGVINFARNL